MSPSAKAAGTDQGRYHPTPDRLRSLVLDYLCHQCYTKTAREFVKRSTAKQLDADGDEVMGSKRISSDGLSDETLQLIKLREKIRMQISRGNVPKATELLRKHFPSVLNANTGNAKVPEPSSSDSPFQQSVAISSVNPLHVSLNLQILAFIESARTIPLDIPSPEEGTDGADSEHETGGDDPARKQIDLLMKARKLHASAQLLNDADDRKMYLKELQNVTGLLAYKEPEKSPISIYLTQERRDAVADQVNKAILHHSGHGVVSDIELCVRYTSNLWSILHDIQVRPPAVDQRPLGVQLPPSAKSPAEKLNFNQASEQELLESMPPFNLRQFLDTK